MLSNWNQVVSQLPLAHFLQTEQWASVKKSIGWSPSFLCWNHQGGLFFPLINSSIQSDISAAALVLERKIQVGGLNTGLSMLYIPKGPSFDWRDQTGQIILGQILDYARRKKAIFIKVDPDIILGTGFETEGPEDSTQGSKFQRQLQEAGWQFSPEQVQFRNTVQIDIGPDIDVLFSKMKSKTRYNVRLAEKKGVNIRIGSKTDLPFLYTMYAETALRDNFIIRERRYYLNVWELFMDNQMAEPLIAEVAGDPIAAVIVIRFAGKAWYVYGMSRDVHREKMPNYLLQWKAILNAKDAGCKVYDFWGAPNHLTEKDPLLGVFRFKEGFGGQVVRTIGAWDYALKPNLYHFSMILLPKILDVLRKKARRQLKTVIQT
jgi:peptidoglycan pentaglycine glycine transferase (the first glycine)